MSLMFQKALILYMCGHHKCIFITCLDRAVLAEIIELVSSKVAQIIHFIHMSKYLSGSKCTERKSIFTRKNQFHR